MSYPDAAWQRAMTVQQLIWKLPQAETADSAARRTEVPPILHHFVNADSARDSQGVVLRTHKALRSHLRRERSTVVEPALRTAAAPRGMGARA